MENYILISVSLTVFVIALLVIIYKKKKRQQKNIFGILGPYLQFFYALFILSVIFFFVLFSYKFFPPDNKVIFFESLIEHFDSAGLIIGIIGITIGLITVIYVEEQNKFNNERVNNALIRLDKATNQINRNVTNLREITKVKRVFESIKGIIKHADDQSNKLYILTHLTSFGQFLIRNVGIITRETQTQIQDFKMLGATEFYDAYLGSFIKLKNSLDEDLEKFVVKKKEVEFAVLRNERINPNHVDKLEPFIKERLMKGKRAILIKSNENLPINYENNNSEDLYIHNCDINLDPKNPLSYAKQNDVFITEIIKHDSEFIKALRNRSTGNLKINTLDYVPFQFFISTPKNERSDTDWRAVIIFSNYFNLGYDQSVVSFSTQNPILCSGLKRMFEKLVVAQEKKDEILNPIQRLFNGCFKMSIALKNVDIEDENISKKIGFRYVTPVPDILAKDSLLILFKEFDIKYSPAARYVKNKPAEIKMIVDHSLNDITYMAVGLFYNPVTEYLSGLGPTQGNPFFELIHRDQPEGKNRLKVAIGGKTKSPDYKIFEETFKDEDGSSCDYTILCRLRLNGKWIYAGGGINYFGSQHFEECIRYGATKISEKFMEKPFIALFELKSSDPPTLPKLLHISYINGDKIECEQCV